MRKDKKELIEIKLEINKLGKGWYMFWEEIIWNELVFLGYEKMWIFVQLRSRINLGIDV